MKGPHGIGRKQMRFGRAKSYFHRTRRGTCTKVRKLRLPRGISEEQDQRGTDIL